MAAPKPDLMIKFPGFNGAANGRLPVILLSIVAIATLAMIALPSTLFSYEWLSTAALQAIHHLTGPP
jgi:hypothetical protein